MILMRQIALAAAVAALAACSTGSGGMRRSLGLEAPPPDPFLTVARAPLSLPADKSALPPPRPGAVSRVEPDAQAQAQAALLGRPAPAAAAPASGGETALLAAAGAGAADPAIRDQLAAEAAPSGERRFGLDSLFGYEISQNPQAEAEKLEPEAEAERLRAEGLQAPVPPPAPAED